MAAPDTAELPVIRLAECVVNISEGRDRAIIERIAGAARAAPGVALLDLHADASHHRSVLTLAGPPDSLGGAVLALAREALDRIDLTRHEGQHPRIGAVDVVPFVPLSGVTMEECITLAHSTGTALATRFDVPVFLYGRAASDSRFRFLPAIRGNGVESLAERMRAGTVHPDAGPSQPHPTAGAIAVGARELMAAFNILLDTDDRAIAADIARRIRTTGGGPPGVQARGFLVDGWAQVSMNLYDLHRTTPEMIWGLVAAEAERRGVDLRHSEIVGLAPAFALPSGIDDRIRLNRPAAECRLETMLQHHWPDWRGPVA